MKWHDDYTINEIEHLMTEMCNWIGEHLDDCYNCSNITELEELISIYVDMGFHEDEVRSWYYWVEE